MDKYNNNNFNPDRKDFCIFSYNSRGFHDGNQSVCKDLLTIAGNKIPIICNQENFLLKANKLKIQQCLPDHHIYFNPATKEGLNGRPRNGMFIAIPRYLKANVTDVSPSSSRLQAITLNTGCRKLLILNTYFPQDPKTDNFDTSDLLIALVSIKNIIKENEFTEMIWSGDINADFSRATKFVKIVDNFVDESNLVKSWDQFEVDYTHEHHLGDTTHTSVIDHFFWNEYLDSHISSAGVLHLPHNLSDHSPVYCVVQNDETSLQKEEIKKSEPKPSWKKATQDERNKFFKKLDQRLKCSDVPDEVTSCNDVHCKNVNHKATCDDYVLNILNIMEQTARDTLPIPKPRETSHKSIPRWDEDIDPFRKNALFWHSVWQSAGKPLNTELHRIMKKTRNVYHFQIRKNKRMLDAIKKNKLLDACLNNQNGIFEEIKASRKSTPSFANKIDGENENIPQHFANKYEKLYNSVGDKENLLIVKKDICQRIVHSDMQEVSRITPEIIKEASNKLKKFKSDPVSEIVSDYLINAPDALYTHLSNILKSFTIHGHLSSTLAICTLLPIIKDKLGNSSDSNNYRSIAISSVILKLFDWVFIILYNKSFQLDALQFSYQPNCSTSMCTWMAIETIDYFLRNNSEVFLCTMDMTKAFDNVKHSKLFEKLIQRDIPAIILRFLMCMYEIQVANVKWNNCYSMEFSIRNGVKQGAVLSALLYCIYVDDLFKRLRNHHLGCWINGEFMGLLGYADDNLLLSPTLDGLQQMVKICEIYSKEHNLSFSTNENTNKSKTKCMAFLRNKRDLKPVILCGHNLPWVKTIRHLGNKMENKLDGMRQDMREKRAYFIQKNNEICQEFSYADPMTKIKLNSIYNSHFTGSPVWDLYCKEFEQIEKTWNVAIRKMLQLHYATHKYFIEPLSGTQHIRLALTKRFINFTQKLAKSMKTPIKLLYNCIRRDCRSVTGNNLRQIMLLLNGDNIDALNTDLLNEIKYHEATGSDEKCRIEVVKELLDVKRKIYHLENFNDMEVDQILQYLCTT